MLAVRKTPVFEQVRAGYYHSHHLFFSYVITFHSLLLELPKKKLFFFQFKIYFSTPATENFTAVRISVTLKIDLPGIPLWAEEQGLSPRTLWGPTHTLYVRAWH